MALDMSDILNMEAAQNLASIPRNMQTDRMLEEQNEAIRSQNATILKLREQNKQLREKFYELMSARDEWQAREESTIDTVREYVNEGALDRDEFNAKRRKILAQKRIEVPERNGTPAK